jgi:hypothetical protein
MAAHEHQSIRNALWSARMVAGPLQGAPHDGRDEVSKSSASLRLRFPEELCLLGKAKAGDNGALGMLARNHWGWDRSGATTMLGQAPTGWRRRMVSVLAGVGRPHKEIATLVVNPRTGKPIDDVTLLRYFLRTHLRRPMLLAIFRRDHPRARGPVTVVGRSQRRSSPHPRRGEGGVPCGRKGSRIVWSRFVNREHVSLGWCSGTNNILLACL